MNFISTFEELDKLYESMSTEESLDEGIFGLGNKKNAAGKPSEKSSEKYDAAYKKALEKTPVVVKVWRDKSHDPEIVDYFDSNMAAEGVVRRHQTDVDKSVVYRYMTAAQAEKAGALVSLPSKYVNKYLEEGLEEACASKKVQTEGCNKDTENDIDEGVLGTALAVGAGALAGTALGNALSEDTEEDFVEDDEPRSVIVECSKCGGLIIKTEADCKVDEAESLVNVGEACKYCEATEGYTILGTFVPYEEEEIEIEDDEDDSDSEDNDVDNVDDEVVEEGLLDVNLPVDVDVTANGNEVAVGGATV